MNNVFFLSVIIAALHHQLIYFILAIIVVIIIIIIFIIILLITIKTLSMSRVCVCVDKHTSHSENFSNCYYCVAFNAFIMLSFLSLFSLHVAI